MKHKMSIQKAKSLLPQFQAALQEKHYTIRTINEICINVKTYLRSITDRYDYVTEKNLKDYLQERKLHTNGKRINCIQNACRKYFNFLFYGDVNKCIETDHTLISAMIKNCLMIEFIASLKNVNSEYTIQKKVLAVQKFLVYLKECKVADVSNIHVNALQEYLNNITIEDKAYLRAYFDFLFTNQVTTTNLANFIHYKQRPKKLPSVYTEEELQKLVNCIDEDTPVNIRNKALIVLIATTGLRSCDISNLKYSEIDLISKQLHITQIKTGVPLALKLSDETVRLICKLKEMYPYSDDAQHVFLKHNAPHREMSTGSIRHVLRESFQLAGIDTSSRKHGPHSLRSSLATAMISHDYPYEIVQKTLGHTDFRSISKYVRTNIELLRLCALPSMNPTGAFQRWLEETDA